MSKLEELQEKYDCYIRDSKAPGFFVPGNLDYSQRYVAFDYNELDGRYRIIVQANSVERLEYLLSLTQKENLTFWEAGQL